MQNPFFSDPLWRDTGLSFIRMIVGLFMVYHGWEVFDGNKMNEYAGWDAFRKFSSPSFVVYIGKIAELAAGLLLMIGLFTRLASVVLMLTMLYISFFVGHGKIWYEDQHPFLFVLLSLVFLFTGPGKWSMDYWLFQRQKQQNP